MKNVTLYTDGACRGNPGPGGWGSIVDYKGSRKELSGFETETTNNRMELTAVIKGLKTITENCKVHIVTDSQYVKNGMTLWIENWKAKGWNTAAKKPVKNQDLWQQLDEEIQKHKVEWTWVKGHSGHKENERCDTLANLAIDNH
jgi:ribonuclease HI